MKAAPGGISIKKTLMYSYVLIIALMILPTAYSIYVSASYTRQYNSIITNVSNANRLNQIVKMDVSDEIWDIVAGKKSFSEGRQYDIIRTIREGLENMIGTSASNRHNDTVQYLEVASRALRTLEKYVDLLGSQTAGNASVDENGKILEEVRGVSALIHEILQDYIVAEIESAAKTNEAIRKNSVILTLVQSLIAAIVLLFAIQSLTAVSGQIRAPIHQLELLSSKIAEGDLEARAELPRVDELDNLTQNLNIMAGKIRELIDENIREQQNFQKEQMKTLQAQITPHFLYNTFDTIIWLAESGRTDEVVEITRAFSGFFRISLSKGHEWITVGQELEHVRNYLTIQKIRYRDILNYSIDADENIDALPVLKLVLQPLVENAIYHGIENKRGRGLLRVTAKLENGMLYFSVSDNGIGIADERMNDIRSELSDKSGTENLSAIYGLYNVSRRLALYYGGRAQFTIESEYGKGTVVSFSVPSEAGNA